MPILYASLILGIASTCLVRPWFWISLVKRDLFQDETKIGFTRESWKDEVGIEIVCFIITFVVSLLLFNFGVSTTFWGFLFPMALCCFFQLAWDNQTPQRIAFAILIIFCLVACVVDSKKINSVEEPLRDVLVVDLPTKPINVYEKGENGEEVGIEKNFIGFLDNNQLETLFGVDEVYGPYYCNSKFVYRTTGGTHRYGVIVIDSNELSKGIFIACKTDGQYKSFHYKYPSYRISSTYMSVSDDNTPYALYGIAKKDGFFGDYSVTKYILVNMVTEEEEIITSIDQIPEFMLK